MKVDTNFVGIVIGTVGEDGEVVRGWKEGRMEGSMRMSSAA